MRSVPTLRQFRLIGPVDWSAVRELAALGWPISLITAVEILLFMVASLVIGMFGATALAAHQISMSFAAVTFMVPLAISQAVNVRVGFHIGAGSPRTARLAAIVGFLLGIGFMSLAATSMLTLPTAIAGLYITAGDPLRGEVIALTVRLLSIAAAFQIFDGAQTIAAGALRGIKDTRIPVLVAAFGYWAVGFVIAWGLGVRLGMGVVGIWWGLAAGLASVAILLSLRFWLLSAGLIRAAEEPAGFSGRENFVPIN
jgi:MATE family multidrug resistance protein